MASKKTISSLHSNSLQPRPLGRVPQAALRRFQRRVREHYRKNGRKFPWRETADPYAILVSEVMLQQTQTERVRAFYERFLAQFPSPRALAKAPLHKVLAAWQGLGYNRRALLLKRAAEQMMVRHHGKVPEELETLKELPGIGTYTAAAVRAFAFQKAEVLIETNIRTAYLHTFFSGREKVGDQEILSLIEATLNRRNPRLWYWALMDYGAMLKRRGVRLNARSLHYRPQARFHGSNRELRGKIIRALLHTPHRTLTELVDTLCSPREIVREQLHNLKGEGMIAQRNGRFSLC